MDTSSVPLMMDIEGGGGEEDVDNKPRLEDDFAYHNNVAGASKHVRLGERIRGIFSGRVLHCFSLQVS